jgi:hypothetical protein
MFSVARTASQRVIIESSLEADSHRLAIHGTVNKKTKHFVNRLDKLP